MCIIHVALKQNSTYIVIRILFLLSKPHVLRCQRFQNPMSVHAYVSSYHANRGAMFLWACVVIRLIVSEMRALCDWMKVQSLLLYIFRFYLLPVIWWVWHIWSWPSVRMPGHVSTFKSLLYRQFSQHVSLSTCASWRLNVKGLLDMEA